MTMSQPHGSASASAGCASPPTRWTGRLSSTRSPATLRPAAALWQRQRAIQVQRGDAAGVAATTRHLAMAYFNVGDTRTALALSAEAVRLHDALPDPGTLLTASVGLHAAVLRKARRPQESLAAYGRFAQLAREDRNGPQVAEALANAGEIQIELRSYEDAQRLLSEALTLNRKLGRQRSEATNLANIALAKRRGGDPEASLTPIRKALSLAVSLKDEPLSTPCSGTSPTRPSTRTKPCAHWVRRSKRCS